MKRIIVSTLFALGLLGCEKKVDLDLEEVPPKLVVEATIEIDEAPVVILTKSLAYFSAISPQLLANSFVRNAEITVSNGTATHRLKEYSLALTPGYFIYYYSIDSSNLATAFTGKLNTAYTLEIKSEGVSYSSKTTIPGYNKELDSIWFKPVVGDTSNKEVQVYVRARDPQGFGNYIRYWTRRNSEAFLPGIISVFDDMVIDGTQYDILVEPGVDRNEDKVFEPRPFSRGDTVTLKLSGIDKPTFDFWRTMEYTYTSVGNPFSSPIKVLGNISNGALGYFGGYASQYKTIIIPR